MILFFSCTIKWRPRFLPLSLRTNDVTAIMSRCNPKVLFSSSTSEIRLGEIADRAEDLSKALRRMRHLKCYCCKTELALPTSSRFCGKCSRSIVSTMLIMKCQACSKLFERKYCEHAFRVGRGMKGVYCNRECTANGRRKITEKIQKYCSCCNKTRVPTWRKFCSLACYNKSRTKVQSRT